MSQPRTSVTVVGLLFLLLLSTCDIPWAETVDLPNGSSFLLERSVLSCGGSQGSGATGLGNGTLGQPTPVGEGSAGDRILRTGFWTWSPGANSGLVSPAAQTPADWLLQNFPNPLRASTTIEYILAEECMVRMSVFNVQGQRIKTLVSRAQAPGRYCEVWDGRDDTGEEASPGIYFYRLDAGSHRTVRKMVLAR